MAKYVEVISGEHKGLQCFVRASKGDDPYYKTFENILLKKSDCKVIKYEKHWVPTKDPGCRYRE